MKRPNSLREILRSKSTPDLIWLLETAEPRVQQFVGVELGRRKAREAAPLLRRRLESTEPSVREAAAEALGEIGDSDSGEALLTLFRDQLQPVPVRDTCAYALAQLRYQPAMLDLVSALSDRSPTVRLCAVAALAAIKNPRAVRPLKLAIETEADPAVRDGIRKALEVLPQIAVRPDINAAAKPVFQTQPPLLTADHVSRVEADLKIILFETAAGISVANVLGKVGVQPTPESLRSDRHEIDQTFLFRSLTTTEPPNKSFSGA